MLECCAPAPGEFGRSASCLALKRVSMRLTNAFATIGVLLATVITIFVTVPSNHALISINHTIGLPVTKEIWSAQFLLLAYHPNRGGSTRARIRSVKLSIPKPTE